MRKEFLIGLFAGLIVLQVAVPVAMIVKRETTLQQGSTFRFKTAPVDPYDAFRGRYVALGFEATRVAQPEGVRLRRGQKVFASLTVDGNGLAGVSGISLVKPHNQAYITAEVAYLSGKNVEIKLPINRYYMEEQAAPRAEHVYRTHSSRDKQDAYVVVKIKDGFAVIEGLYIGAQKIEDVIKTGTH